jgi:SAM-dependent methyltransferase
MLPKPKHLSREYASVFQDTSVIDAYAFRPPYPEETFSILAGLIVDAPRAVLDVGCGTGDVARPFAARVDRIDAADVSAGMIEKGRRLPGGSGANLRWILSSVEEATLNPPYALITAGESLHWFDWERALPRFRDLLAPHGVLAILGRNWDLRREVWDRVLPLIRRYSTNTDFRAYDLIEELELRGLFERLGGATTAPVPWRPTIDEYVECRHSQNGFSRDRMTLEHAASFDSALREALRALCEQGIIDERNGRLELEVVAHLTWGRPAPERRLLGFPLEGRGR